MRPALDPELLPHSQTSCHTSFSDGFYRSKKYISKSENASVVASRQLIKTLESEFSWTEQGLREVPWYDTWRLY